MSETLADLLQSMRRVTTSILVVTEACLGCTVGANLKKDELDGGWGRLSRLEPRFGVLKVCVEGVREDVPCLIWETYRGFLSYAYGFQSTLY